MASTSDEGAAAVVNPHEALLIEAAAAATAGGADHLPTSDFPTAAQHRLQARFAAHRARRNQDHRDLFLSPSFAGVVPDAVLSRLLSQEKGYADPRHSLVVWARPPHHIVRLAGHVQAELATAAPGLWLMPAHRLHMTVLEIAHSQPAAAIDALVSALRPALPPIADLTRTRRHAGAGTARLLRPQVSFDASGVALTFLPAAAQDDHAGSYTYQHLRRDVYAHVSSAVAAAQAATGGGGSSDLPPLASRYVYPSAHVTLARFVTAAELAAPEQRAAWVAAVDSVNAWLEADVWTTTATAAAGGGSVGEFSRDFCGEWAVGEENGLVVRAGTVWYGGGRTVAAGEGF
ncbi:RNA ligase/cyclic nucleotide phosphodiesterase [Zopfochytrium polystomum]|nr:RNA ligase/cyclic nucleotide phosphodiesterase [Zopfochytrium polystomum]